MPVKKTRALFSPLCHMTSYFGGECPRSSKVLKDVSALALRPVDTHSVQNQSLVGGGWSCVCSLAHPPMHRRLPGALFLHMRKPYFSSLGDVFSDMKNNSVFSF